PRPGSREDNRASSPNPCLAALLSRGLIVKSRSQRCCGDETMTRRKVALLWALAFVLAGAIVLILGDPCFWVRKGMTYDEVEAVLGKQLNGLRPCAIDDGSWTGLWPGYLGIIEVRFDGRDKVRSSPSIARRLLEGLEP